MALRKGSTGARFQVTLKADGAGCVGELDDDMKVPRSMRGGVWTAPCVVVLQPRVYIRGETNIEARTVGWILDHVDDPLVPRHDTGGEQSTCLGDSVGKGRKFE